MTIDEIDKMYCEKIIKNYQLEDLVPAVIDEAKSVTQSSIALKHIFEEITGHEITNGQMIYIMIRLGYDYKIPRSNYNNNLDFYCKYNIKFKRLLKENNYDLSNVLRILNARFHSE